MKNLFVFFLLSFHFSAISQGLINNGIHIVLTTGIYIYIDGDSNGGFTNQGAGLIESDGTFSLEGNWINNSSTNVYTAVNNTGSTILSGTTLQQIGGTDSTIFENLIINNTGPGVYISQNEKVQYTLTMIDGDFDLRNNNVQLVDITSTVSGEGELNRIKSTNGISDGLGTGTIYAIRTNPSGNVANLGLDFTPGVGLGSTKIIRGHERQQGSGSFTANYSIFRYYEIQPTTTSTLTINNFYYWGGIGNPELNGHTEANLEMFQRVNLGGPTYWTPRPGVVTTASDFIASSTINNAVAGTVRITLASTTAPLPIELISFTAICQNGKILINWTTASEINNDFFTLEKSTDGKDFYTMATISGAGNSNMENNYEYYDGQSENGTVYYRLSQTDFNGDEQVFNIVAANCSGNSIIEDNFIIINNPANESVQLQLTGTEGNRYTLSFIDQLGRQLIEKKIILNNSNQTITVNTQNLSESIYSVVYRSDKNVITKQLMIIK